MKNISYPLLYGFIVAAGLIVYFLILSIFGAHTNPAYSIFNMVILAVGIYFAVHRYKKEHPAKFKDQTGFSVGLTTGFIATAIFTFFFGLYASEINPGFIDRLLTVWEFDWHINLGMVLFTVGLMGAASTVVVTFALNQLYKDTWNTKEGREHTF